MEKISETEEGGRVLTEDESLFGGLIELRGRKAGETTSVVRTTVFRDMLQIPFEVTVTKEIAPPLDTEGKPMRELSKASLSAKCSLPFTRNNVSGRVEIHVYCGDEASTVQDKLIEELGIRVVELQFKPQGD